MRIKRRFRDASTILSILHVSSHSNFNHNGNIVLVSCGAADENPSLVNIPSVIFIYCGAMSKRNPATFNFAGTFIASFSL
jgi:hypothetical protein